MAAPQNIVTYGDFSTPLLLAESYSLRDDGLDDANFTLVDNSADTFTPGNRYNGFLIKTANPTRVGEVWEHSLSCIGVRGSKNTSKLVRRSVNHTLDGFDSASETWLTTNQNRIINGARLAGWSNMVCESVTPEEITGTGWYNITANYRGITKGKPVKRSISSNIDISVVDNLVLLGAGGQAGAHRWAIAWPKVTVTFSYVGTAIEQKPMPAQGGTPAGPLPVIRNALDSLPSGSDFTYNWPNGWRLVAMPQEEIAGTNISFTQEIWEWQQKVTV